MNIIHLMNNESYMRLRKVMLELEIDMTDADLARKFNLPDQHITHWKNRGVPKSILIELADEWKFRIKYVLDGAGEMFDSSVPYRNSPEYQVLEAMQNMDVQTKYQVVKISNTLAEPAEKTNGAEK